MNASRSAAPISTVVLALSLLGAPFAVFAATPSLQVSPEISLADEAITIRAIGLQPGAAATISATTRDGSGNRWRSSVTCVADRTGTIDLRRCVPVNRAGGSAPASTYSKPDGMGLFWSMRQEDGASTFFYFPAAPSAVYEFELSVNGAVVQRALAERKLMSDGVVRDPLTKSEDGIVGVAFEPEVTPTAKPDGLHSRTGSKAAGDIKRHPAVILVSGSGGGHQLDQLAELLASHGYEALSLAYYTGFSDSEGLPPELLSIPLETVGKGLAWLKTRPGVDASRIAIIGHSRGSELALLSAANFPQIKAAVVLAGSPVAWPGINPRDYNRDFPAWTLHGKPLPFLPSTAYFAKAYHEHRPPSTAFEQALDNTRAVNAAFIPLERIHGPILFLGGDADAIWPSKRMAEMAMAYLHQHHHPFKDRIEMFPDAGHWFFEPYIPVENRVTWSKYDLKFGGTAAGDAHAAPEAWSRILNFLGASMPPPTEHGSPGSARKQSQP